MEPVDAIITDPVWPNSTPDLIGADDPWGLFGETAQHFPRLCKRLVVHLGGISDPRFLRLVPDSMPFMRLCWLQYVRPNYYGRFLGQADVAYAFGSPVPAGLGPSNLIPAQHMDTTSNGKDNKHPTPRKIGHVRWLVKWFSVEGETVLDPFMGSGTTIVAAREAGRKAIGIEIEERWCELAVKRIAQMLLPLGAIA